MATNYKNIAKKIKFESRAFINGKYVNAIDGKKFETINPAGFIVSNFFPSIALTYLPLIKALLSNLIFFAIFL